MTSLDRIEIAITESVGSATAEEWDRLVGDGSPFVEHAWLRAMETSGAVGPGTGWAPHIMTARADGRLVGAIPLYLKGHSFGEYVYDWAWADLATRVGVDYYPKIIAASPFSPVTGPRILVDDTLAVGDAAAVFDTLVGTAIQVASDNEIAGVHLLFLDEPVARKLADKGLLMRQAHQYHWKNDGYETFADFLGAFRSKRRREIRRERRRLAEQGYRVEAVGGEALTEEQMDDVFRFYSSTCSKYSWGRQYLNREFFRDIHASMPERIVAMLARDPDGNVIAGTFNLRKGERIYGRYWGCDVDVPFLHFETCYYATIEYAIREGLRVMEPGAGGDHKYVRGFEPEIMYSAHWIADPRLASILDRAVEHESRLVDETVERMVDASPLRKKGECEGDSAKLSRLLDSLEDDL